MNGPPTDTLRTVIRSDLLADMAGLESPGALPWQEFILSLPDEDLLLLRGRLIQEFGRLEVVAGHVRGCSTRFLATYLRSLEAEFQEWLASPEKLIGYFVAAHPNGRLSESEPWFWNETHIKSWPGDVLTERLAPRGIRVAPLLAKSTYEFATNVLGPALARIPATVQHDPAERERLVAYLEKWAKKRLGLEPLEDLIGALKLLRCSEIGRSQIAGLSNADIDAVTVLLRKYDDKKPEKWVRELGAEVAALSALGTVGHWVTGSLLASTGSTLSPILDELRSRGLFATDRIRVNRSIDTKANGTLLNRLLVQLSAREFELFAGSIARVEAGLGVVPHIREWRRNLEAFMRKEIDTTLSRLRADDDSSFTMSEIDHWMARKY